MKRSSKAIEEEGFKSPNIPSRSWVRRQGAIFHVLICVITIGGDGTVLGTSH